VNVTFMDTVNGREHAGTLAFIDIDSMQKRVYGYPANNWSAWSSVLWSPGVRVGG